MVPSLIFPGRDSSAYCRTMMAILNAKGKKTHTHRTVSSTQDWLTDQPTTWLEPLLAGILIKETFEPPYIAGNSAVLQTRASLPMLWIFNLFSLISCTLLFFGYSVWWMCMKKNVSLGKQLQFVNLKKKRFLLWGGWGRFLLCPFLKSFNHKWLLNFEKAFFLHLLRLLYGFCLSIC